MGLCPVSCSHYQLVLLKFILGNKFNKVTVKLTCSIHAGSLDVQLFIVSPINIVISRAVVNSNCMSDIGDGQNHISVVWSVKRDAANVCPPCKQQKIMRTCPGKKRIP